MNKKYLVLIAALVAVLLSGCEGEKKKTVKFEDSRNQPQMQLSSNDSTTVRELTNDFLELVKNGQIDEAVSHLYVLDGENVYPMPEDQKEECRYSLGAFDIKGYGIKKLTFFKETDSEVEYALYLDQPSVDRKPRAINGLIRPVRRDGVWYITLANGSQRSEIQK